MRIGRAEAADADLARAFAVVEEARQAAASEPMKHVLDELRSVGAVTKVLLLERSPFTPEPILAEIQDTETDPATPA